MKRLVRTADSVFVRPGSRRIIRTAARGEAVDMDKYDKDGRENPFHGWTLDFPEYVPHAERTYSNKDRAQGWYDDPENEPQFGSKWGGSGDYADRAFHEHTQQYNQGIDPNRGDEIDPSGALGQYDIAGEDENLNEYHPQGRHLRPMNQTGYPEGFSDNPGVEQRGIYSTRPDLNPWEDVQQAQDEQLARALSPSTHQYTTPRSSPQRQEGWRNRVLPEGHQHDPHDDRGNTYRVFGLWHGGSSYAHGDHREDMESFPSLEDAQRAVEGRYQNYNRGHGGEVAAYDSATGTHHLVGNGHDSTLDTPAVDRSSHMEIYHAEPSYEHGGWRVNTEDGPTHYIWINADGDAVVGHDRGSYDESEDDYGYDDSEEEPEEQGSHPKQERFTNAGFEYHPHEYNGDRYTREDHNGNTHVLRAPNPSYGSMDTWRYEFHPKNEQDRDPYAPRDAQRDGPRSLSYHANDPDEAWNLHQNLGNDLSELAARGWGFHKINLGDAGIPGNARHDNRDTGVLSHYIEAHRRSADDEGYDRVIRSPQGWAAHHVPDPTPQDRHPRVTQLVSSPSRRDVLDETDRHDAHWYLEGRGNAEIDPETGHTTYEIPHAQIGSDHFTVQVPHGGANAPRWIVTHRRDGRIQSHTSYPNWAGARDELRGRI